MAEENNGNSGLSALEQLKAMQQNDKKISMLNINEPLLEQFDATDVFELDALAGQQEKKRIFKRTERKAQEVKVRSTAFENEENTIAEVIIGKPRAKKRKPVEAKPVETVVQEPEEPKAEEVVVQEPEHDEEDAIFGNLKIENEDMAISDDQPGGTVEAEIVDEIEVNQGDVAPSGEADINTDSVLEETISAVKENIPDVTENYDEDDLYVDKQKFSIAHYTDEEEYLSQQSRDGYHFVRNVGKKYYFVKAAPRNFYYSMNYFREEPDAELWKQWEADGWKLVSRMEGKRRDEAGWFVFRNELERDGFKKEIENDEEKFLFFKRNNNSYRTTLLLIFLCMVICAAAAYLIYRFNGYLLLMAPCAVVFFIALIMFIVYCGKLHQSKKTTKAIKARLRVKGLI